MAELTLAAETGRPTGSRPANRLRGEGRIPGVVYGQGGDSVIVSIDRRDLRLILASETGVNSLIALKVNGKTESAVIKELQRHPVKRNVTHVDFLRVNLNEAIEVEVTLHLVGEAVEVGRGGGLVDLATNSITVSAKPNAIPTRIDVDVTNLNIGDVVRLADLVLPAGVTAVQDPETTIVTVELSRTGAAALAAAATAAEGESAAPAE
ncbi:MAG: 50S ribosomal protein L25 [Acidimicrobiia bacterium]